LHPDKMDEEKYEPPREAGEETKAIPIVTADHYAGGEHEDTVVHASGDDTKPFKGKAKPGEPKKGKKAKGKKKKKKLLILSIVLYVLLAYAVAALFIIPGFLQPKSTTVPDVIECEYDEAVEELEANHLEVEKEEIFSEEIEEGYIVKTSPRADRTVKEGSKVTLYVSQGKEKIAFEDYVGKDFSQVKQMLDDREFSEVISMEKFSDAPEGEITKQIQPDPGQEIIPSDTRV